MLSYQLFYAGYCTHPEWVTIKGGGWRNVKFPALCALIKHPEHGFILFDTGYHPRFFTAAKSWPLSLYPRVTPAFVRNDETILCQLQKQGIEAHEIKTVILSHLHADHIAGLKDFPDAALFCSHQAYQAVQHVRGIAALRQGFLPDLLPSNFNARTNWIEQTSRISLENTLHPFTNGYDLFEDGRLIAVALPGHATGQYGLLLQNNGHWVFLVADACWSSAAYREHRPPSFVTRVLHDQKAYLETLEKLHRLHQNNPSVHIIPSHCAEKQQQYA